MTPEEQPPVSKPVLPLGPPKATVKETAPRRGKLRLVLGIAVGIGILSMVVAFVVSSIGTVSTDDAYVNGYVTFVAPRVKGQVLRVLVDDNNRVKKGDLLVELDPEPYRVQVAIKQAMVDSAQADIVATQATIRGLVAQVRSQRFALVHAMEDVDNQVAIIRGRASKWEQSKARLALAQSEYDRATRLFASRAVSTEQVEEKRAALDVATSQVNQDLQDVYQARVSLGLPGPAPEGGSLTDVPSDLNQTFSSVRVALGTMLHGAAQLGVAPSSYNLTPKEIVDEFYRRDPGGDIDKIYAEIMKEAPSLKQAQASLQMAERDLDSAKLDLSYCTIVAEIDGVITRRNVNPGNNVQAGQSLLALRSLRDVWIDANFKETQLRDLRIGQHVSLETDLYGSKQTFEGRISGFTMGTGSTLALLPAQNATGNFVKVVQRLPVRIDVVNYDPDKLPLFIGLSVVPTVDLKTEPTGPNAGKYLQEVVKSTVSAASPQP